MSGIQGTGQKPPAPQNSIVQPPPVPLVQQTAQPSAPQSRNMQAPPLPPQEGAAKQDTLVQGGAAHINQGTIVDTGDRTPIGVVKESTMVPHSQGASAKRKAETTVEGTLTQGAEATGAQGAG